MSIWRPAAAVASGLLLAAAFPPLGRAQLAWLALVPLVVIIRFSGPRTAFRWGWVAGFVFWGCTLAWLRRLARFDTPWPVVGCAWLMLAAYCALYTGAFAAAAARLWADDRARSAPSGALLPGLRNLARVCVMALLWVGFEYVRSTFCTGFSWNALGISQYRSVSLIQIAEWGGVYAVSALIVMGNGALAITSVEIGQALRRQEWSSRRIHVEFMAATLCVVMVMGYGHARVRALQAESARTPGLPVRCAAVQANVPQDEKWSDELANDVRDRFCSLTERAARMRPDLVIWPETSSPFALSATVPTFLNDLAAETAPLLAGGIEIGTDASGREAYYNSAFLYGADGRLNGVYRKQHLVPFGEYVPLANVLPWLERFSPLGYSCRAGATGTVFRLGPQAIPFASLICFEDAIAGLSRRAVRNGARLLVNQTNDGWFDETSLAVQHLSQSVFRCVENRVPQVRCVNLGISCTIDRTGALDTSTAQALAQGEPPEALFRVDRVEVPSVGYVPTVYTRYGDWVFAIPCAALGLAVLGQGGWAGWRRRNGPIRPI